MADLTINDVLPKICKGLADHGAAVLIAPPGAGKTTAVAPALLAERWCTRQIIITSPRRVAARAAAERMAELLGERVGEIVGYQTRLDSRTSSKTRIIVVTEAILVNRLIADPDLGDVSAILFDEAHERHLDCDLGLALALETRAVLRDDLRVLVMSATIDGARFARLLGTDAPVIESKGRSHPLQIEWLGSDPSHPIEDQVVTGVMKAWRDTAESGGDILAFLPGVREIERTHDRLTPKLPDIPILPLHGQIDAAGQRAAIRRDQEGRRRVVLATAIAETSLTLDGVSIVVDSGLARTAEFDRAAGTTHLVTRRASQAAATQRAGRAARQGPGIAYRLWEEAGHLGRPEFAQPEIESADLAPLLLKLSKWGSNDPTTLVWINAPPQASIAAARRSLTELDALDDDGRITRWGEQISAMPMAPDQAAAVLYGAQAECAAETAQLVMLLQERGLGGRGEDLSQRLSRWRADRSKRAENARRVAKGWAAMAEKTVSSAAPLDLEPAECLALARRAFVARKRDQSGEHWVSAGGRGFQLDAASPLASADWIVIGDAQGQAKGARVTSGMTIASSRIEALFSEQLEQRSFIRWNGEKNRVEARREKRLGAIVISSAPDPQPDPHLIVDMLVEKAKENLGKLLPSGFFERAHFAGIEALSAQALQENAPLWLEGLFEARRDIDVPSHRAVDAALNLLDWDTRQQLERAAPVKFTSPAGTTHEIDYAGDDAPSAEVRVQALFGLDTQPMIGATPLLLKLTSPAGRPVAATRDLPGFWRGAWPDVVKDMKGRYPKHRWPDNPWSEKPSLKTKNAFHRG